MNKIDIHGVKIHNVTMREAVQLIQDWVEEDGSVQGRYTLPIRK